MVSMGFTASNKAISTVGAFLFAISTAVNLLRIGVRDNIRSTLELFTFQPAFPTEFLVALAVCLLLVKGAWEKRTVAVLLILGAAMTVLAITGLYSLWELSKASAVPLASVVWVFPTGNLLGGLLVMVGTLREFRGTILGGYRR
jgi:hypothetical protein